MSIKLDRLSVLAMIFALALSSCVTGERESSIAGPIILERGVVENTLSQEVTRVSVLHLPSRDSASVSSIPPRQTAEIGFSPAQLQATTAELTWLANDALYKIRLKLPEVADTSWKRPGVLVYRLLEGGMATVSVKRAPPR